MASVENTKEHMHDVVGTPCCHGGWPAMEEVAEFLRCVSQGPWVPVQGKHYMYTYPH